MSGRHNIEIGAQIAISDLDSAGFAAKGTKALISDADGEEELSPLSVDFLEGKPPLDIAEACGEKAFNDGTPIRQFRDNYLVDGQAGLQTLKQNIDLALRVGSVDLLILELTWQETEPPVAELAEFYRLARQLAGTRQLGVCLATQREGTLGNPETIGALDDVLAEESGEGISICVDFSHFPDDPKGAVDERFIRGGLVRAGMLRVDTPQFVLADTGTDETDPDFESQFLEKLRETRATRPLIRLFDRQRVQPDGRTIRLAGAPSTKSSRPLIPYASVCMLRALHEIYLSEN
jgi:hypothetical protein